MRRFSRSTYLLLAALIIALPSTLALARGGGHGGHGASRGHAVGHVRVAHHRSSARRVFRGAPGVARSVSSSFHSHGNTHHVAHDFRRGWRNGHWHHGRHHGRSGWWWGVGGIWYYYPEDYRDDYHDEYDDPPRYVSEIAVPQASFAAEPEAPVYVERNHATYYAPGDSSGVSYRTGTECAEAQRKAGGAGICLLK